MILGCPSAIPPQKPFYGLKSKQSSIIVENDHALKQLKKRGISKSTGKAKIYYQQASCVITEPSRKSLTVLKHILHKNLQRVQLYFYSLSSSQNDFLQHYLSRLSVTKSLKITVRASEEVDDLMLEKLSHAVSKLRALETFNFQLVESSQIQSKGILRFFQSISYLPKLNSFGFQIFECPDFNDEVLKESTSYMTRLKVLKNLALDFTNCFEITDEGLSSFSDILSKLSTLQMVKLQFKGCYYITDTGLQALGRSLDSLDCLRGLEINLEYCFEITENGLGELLAKLNKLSCLKINLKDFQNFSDEGLERLGESLNGMMQLKNLVLQLGRCKGITKRAITQLERKLIENRRISSLQIKSN